MGIEEIVDSSELDITEETSAMVDSVRGALSSEFMKLMDMAEKYAKIDLLPEIYVTYSMVQNAYRMTACTEYGINPATMEKELLEKQSEKYNPILYARILHDAHNEGYIKAIRKIEEACLSNGPNR